MVEFSSKVLRVLIVTKVKEITEASASVSIGWPVTSYGGGYA